MNLMFEIALFLVFIGLVFWYIFDNIKSTKQDKQTAEYLRKKANTISSLEEIQEIFKEFEEKGFKVRDKEVKLEIMEIYGFLIGLRKQYESHSLMIELAKHHVLKFVDELKHEDEEHVKWLLNAAQEYVKKINLDGNITRQAKNIEFKILTLQESNNPYDVLDFIFETIDNYLIQGKFELINTLLEIININKLNSNTIIGILTITNRHKNELKYRKHFYENSKIRLNEKHTKEKVYHLLYGLE